MTSLLDIGPLTKEATVRGKQITVYPIGAQSLFHLINIFPGIKEMMEQRGGAFTASDLLDLGPDIVGYVIGIGTTDRDNFPTHKEWVTHLIEVAKVAKKLGVGDQLPLINDIFDLTFGEAGAVPFMNALTTFGRRMGVTDEMLQRFKTQQASSTTPTEASGILMSAPTPVKEPATRSRRPLSAALQMDTIPGKRMRGRIHQGGSTQ